MTQSVKASAIGSSPDTIRYLESLPITSYWIISPSYSIIVSAQAILALRNGQNKEKLARITSVRKPLYSVVTKIMCCDISLQFVIQSLITQRKLSTQLIKAASFYFESFLSP